MSNIIISNRWMFSILIIEANDKNEYITLCERIQKQIKLIIKKVNRSSMMDDCKNEMDNELIEMEDLFDFCAKLMREDIPEKEWDDYEYDGDYEQLFSDYMQQLYNIGDTRVLSQRSPKGQITSNKFIWISKHALGGK